MANWRWYLLNSKEAVIVVVWHAIYCLCCATMKSLVMTSRNYEVLVSILFVTTIIFYTLLGLIGEVFIGRYRLMNFSMWIQWIAMTMSTLMYALKYSHVYDLPQWLEILLVVVPFVVQMFGLSMFQITAIQFGIDQFQGAPSEQLTAFIFWYFCMEQLPWMVLQWVLYLLSNFVTDFSQIQLGCCSLCVLLLSLIICVKSCFMTNWFILGDLQRDTTCMCRNQSTDHKYNPYSLVYRIIKFALKHKHPLQRSALTYWEDEIPSRIDLGKSKYGGPFTSEDVENVKTFFQLIKVLLSLSGVLITLLSLELSVYHKATLASDNSQTVSTRALNDAVILGILVLFYAFLFLTCCRKCLPRMLKRIWLGALTTATSALSILLITFIGLEHQQVLPCYLPFDSIALSPYLLLIPNTLYSASYTVFTISLLEFIIAQSPQAMKGILIGLYYSLRYGLAGLLIFTEFYAFEKYATHYNVLSCATAYYLEITLIGLLSLFIYTIVAYKYKPRERDEVVNVHMFAEEYYTK